MKQSTVEEFINSLHDRRELPVVRSDSSLEEVVRAMVKGHRRRIVYVVEADGSLRGTITLNHLREVIFRFYLNTRVSDAIVVTEHITELFSSETALEILDADMLVCNLDQTLHDVLVTMNEKEAVAVPVLDREGRLIADIDILDLLERWLNLGNEGFE